MNTPKELFARFPYMVSGDHIGLTLYKGWFPLFAQMCVDIDAALGADKRDFHWSQLKEKFGAARWYWSMQNTRSAILINGVLTRWEDAPLQHRPSEDLKLVRDKVSLLIQNAEEKTKKTCIVCAEPASLDASQSYVLVLCAKHARKRFGGGDLGKFWFDAQDEA